MTRLTANQIFDLNILINERSGDDSCDESSDIDKSCLQPTQLQNEQQHKQREIKVKNRWTKEEVCRHTQR